MFVARLGVPGLLAFGLVACSDRIDPRDGEVQEPIPVGVSVAPQRSVPQTGGLNLAAQDTLAPTTEMPGIMDTTRAGAVAPPTAAAAPAAAADTAPTLRPR
jgi:hypothetical protein